MNADAEVEKLDGVISAAFALKGAGCRSVALSPPNPMRSRGIVTLHEWPRQRLIRRTAACYCGAERK